MSGTPPSSWSATAIKALTHYRATMRSFRAAVDSRVWSRAEPEELVDQPEVVKGVVRVSGPFTVEGVRPEELSLGDDGAFDPTPNAFEADDPDDVAVGGGPGPLYEATSYLAKMVALLRNDGVRFLNNQRKRFARLEPLFESGTGSLLHAEGAWGDGPDTIAVTFGPQYGPITAQQVEEAVRAARRYDELVIAGFSFDAEASAAIAESQHPKLRIHQAYIRPDVNPGMDGLLKDTPSSEIFTVFGEPDIEVKKGAEKGTFVVCLNGVDIYDPVENVVRSTGAQKVAAWFLDGDFDGRCFCISQAFFPDQNAWEKIQKALKSSADPEVFDRFKGTESLAFPAGKHKRIAVKVIDPRGNEVMAIRPLPV